MAELPPPQFIPASAAPHPLWINRQSSLRNRSHKPHASPTLPSDEKFLTLVHSYRTTGGLVWVGDLEAMFMLRSTGSDTYLSEAIGQRQLVHFEWQAQTWLPLFQFDLVRMQPHSALSCVLAELNGIYNNDEVAEWFSRINPWLDGRSPAQELASHPATVVDAASAEVFVVRG